MRRDETGVARSSRPPSSRQPAERALAQGPLDSPEGGLLPRRPLRRTPRGRHTAGLLGPWSNATAPRIASAKGSWPMADRHGREHPSCSNAPASPGAYSTHRPSGWTLVQLKRERAAASVKVRCDPRLPARSLPSLSSLRWLAACGSTSRLLRRRWWHRLQLLRHLRSSPRRRRLRLSNRPQSQRLRSLPRRLPWRPRHRPSRRRRPRLPRPRLRRRPFQKLRLLQKL